MAIAKLEEYSLLPGVGVVKPSWRELASRLVSFPRVDYGPAFGVGWAEATSSDSYIPPLGNADYPITVFG